MISLCWFAHRSELMSTTAVIHQHADTFGNASLYKKCFCKIHITFVRFLVAGLVPTHFWRMLDPLRYALELKLFTQPCWKLVPSNLRQALGYALALLQRQWLSHLSEIISSRGQFTHLDTRISQLQNLTDQHAGSENTLHELRLVWHIIAPSWQVLL